MSGINDKKFTSKFYTYSIACDTLLGDLIDALSGHTGNKDNCYAISLPFSVSFVS